MIGRNPDKEPAVHVHIGRKDSMTMRSTLQDNLSTALSNALKQEPTSSAPTPPPRRPDPEPDYSAYLLTTNIELLVTCLCPILKLL